MYSEDPLLVWIMILGLISGFVRRSEYGRFLEPILQTVKQGHEAKATQES